MDTKDTVMSVMDMTSEEITHHYNALFEQTKNKLPLDVPMSDNFTFNKASILKDTPVSYSTSSQ